MTIQRKLPVNLKGNIKTQKQTEADVNLKDIEDQKKEDKMKKENSNKPTKFHKTHKVRIFPTPRQEKILWQLSEGARAVWNLATGAMKCKWNFNKRKAKKDRDYISDNDLRDNIRHIGRNGPYLNPQDYTYQKYKAKCWNHLKIIPSDMIGLILRYKFKGAWNSFHTQYNNWENKPDSKKYIIKKGKRVPHGRPSSPGFKGYNYFANPMWRNNTQYRIKKWRDLEDNIITKITLNYNPEGHPTLTRKISFDISFYQLPTHITEDQVKLFEISCQNRRDDPEKIYFLHITYDEIKNIPEYHDNGLYLGIDPGISDLLIGATLFSRPHNDKFVKLDFPDHLYTYHADRIAEIQEKQSRCLGNKQGQRKSKKWIYYQKIRKREHSRASNKIKNWTYETVKFFLENCKANTIIVGDLSYKACAKKKKGTGTRWKNKIHKTVSRKLQNYGYSRFYQILSQKAREYGKHVFFIDESYTSKTCCQCGHQQEMPLEKRTYICETCGNTMGRDRNSAINILKRFLECKHSKKKAKKYLSCYAKKSRTKKKPAQYIYTQLSQKPSIAEVKFRKEIGMKIP